MTSNILLFIHFVLLCSSRVPHIGQNLWFVYDNLAEVDEVIKALHVRGVRESRLKTELTKHYESIKHMFSLKRKFEMADYGDGVKNNMLEGFKEVCKNDKLHL